MRRLLALVAILTTVLSLAAVPAAAASYPVLRSVTVLSPGATTRLEVSATSETDISKVRVLVHPVGGDSSTAVDDFELVEGTAKDGVWRTKSALTVGEGRWGVDVELTNADRTLVYNDRAVIENGADTVLTEVEIGPTTIDVENTRGTFKGRLLSKASDGSLQPVANATLRLTRPDGEIATAVTGADGRAAGTTEFTKTGDAVLAFSGDAAYRPVKSAATRITKQRLKTRLSFSMPDRLIVGDKVTVSGRLERLSRDGVWGPLAGKELDLQFDLATGGDWHTIATPTTDANGNYSVQVTITADGAWTIDFANDPANLPDDYYGYELSYAGTNVRMVAYRTSMTGFNPAPEPVALDRKLTGSGTILRKMADGTWTPAPAIGTVVLQFSPDGKSWTNKATQVFDGDGSFHFEVPPVRDGYWRAVVPAGGYTEPYTSWADYIDVKYRTYMTSFNASPEPVSKGKTITVKGLLYRYRPASSVAPGAKISVYFKAAGTSTWKWMADTKTGSDGWFRKTFTASKDGTWMAKYPGSSTYLASNAPTDYVDVR
ncbi:hypothetical protein ACGFJT_15855 [Actinomadura geliboluensis]|uniref:hypothetical protein n=1 Tax=Actinomadura geliboluensis TaxID=882440 RepID=UPI00371EE1FD